MTPRRFTLGWQIFAAVTAVSAVLLIGLGWVVLVRVQVRAAEVARQGAAENAQALAWVASRGLAQSGASFDAALRTVRRARLLFALGADAGNARVQLFDARGRLRFDSDTGRGDRTRPLPADVAVALGRASDALARREVGEVGASAPIRRGPLGDEILGAVRVLRPTLGTQQILASVGSEIAIGALLLLLLAAGAAGLIGRAIGRPIVALTGAARQIAAGDRARRLPEPSGAEVAALTTAFDGMRRELEDKNRIERYAQDLSHELKNPIAAVRALSDALDGGGLADPEVGPRLVGRIREATDRLAAIVADLLDLARLEAAGITVVDGVSLDRLVADARRDVEPLAAARGTKLEIEIGVSGPLRADPVWLRRALANLLANAVTGGASGATVRLQVARAAADLELRVRNPGAISADIGARIFERFASRRPDGTGLGLAIVRGVAEAHGGSAELEAAGPPEVVVRVRLPV